MKKTLLFSTLLLPLVSVNQNLAFATSVSQLTSKTVEVHRADLESQERVDTLDQHRLKSMQEYLMNEREAELHEAYNQQLEQIIASQTTELASLKQQMASIAKTEQSILPMLSSMLTNLTSFVENDTPFLLKERKARIARLAQMLIRADVTVAQKYQQILDAYLIEVEYGRTLETYRGDLLTANRTAKTNKKVDYFRLGRTALYYLTPDKLDSGLWSNAQQQWLAMNDSERLELSKAMQVAQQLRAPELLSLPLPAMEKQDD